MILILKPPGRGNWAQTVMAITQSSKHSPLPLEVRAGQRVQIGGQTFRIASVLL